MEYRFTPSSKVCSREMIIQVEGNIIKNVGIVGGCAGNTIGISSLIKDMNICEVIKRLKGISCGLRGTSCPDQLAIALEEISKNIK